MAARRGITGASLPALRHAGARDGSRQWARPTVVIRDRGLYTSGRIIDLSPHSARKIMFNDGVAQVEVVAVAR